MKTSYIQIGLVALLKTTLAQISSTEPEENVPKAKFDIAYESLERGVGGLSSFMEFENGDNTTFRYTFLNREDHNVSVVGLGGRVYDVLSNENAANISASAVGPIEVGTNETVEFQQIINLILKEGDYVVSPDIYVEKGEETMRVIASPSLVRILPPPMSFFNPKFLFVQLVLGLLIAAFSYFTFFKPSNSKTTQRGSKNINNSQDSKKSADPSWLPANHTRK